MSNYPDMFSLQGQVALITGAAQGIGAEIALALGQAGATVVLSDRDSEQGNKLVAEFGEQGIQASFVHLDVTSEQEWQDAIAYIEDSLRRLDILVNNAGILFSEATENLSLEKFRMLQSINVDGVFLGCKTAKGLMARSATAEKRASIINLSSMAGMLGSSHLLAYCTSKGAVRLMTKSLAAEYGGDNIRVNSVHPGLIQTSMGDDVQALIKKKVGLGSVEEAKVVSQAKIPLRVLGTTRDVASAVLFLASAASNYMTATETVVDGGITGCQ